jgi:hypothetical protein
MIFYQHIYKNGGSTLRDNALRQGICASVKFRDDTVFVRDDTPSHTEWRPLDNCKKIWPIYIGYLPLSEVRKHIPNLQNISITIRDPIDRLMSGYNYFVHHCWLSYGIQNPTISFMTWFANREILAPIGYSSQIDLVLKSCNHLTPTRVFDYYSHVTGDASVIEKNITSWIDDYNQYMMPRAKQALKLLNDCYDNVMILEHDYVEQMKSTCASYGIDVQISTIENKSSNNFGSPNLKFEDLTDHEQQIVIQWSKVEQFFYQECKSVNK